MEKNEYNASTDEKRQNFHRLYRKHQFSRERHLEVLKEILVPTIIMLIMMVAAIVVKVMGLDQVYLMIVYLIILVALALWKLDTHIF